MSVRLFDDEVLVRFGEALESPDVGGPVLETFLTDNLSTQSLVFTLMWTRDITIEIGTLQVRIIETGGAGSWREVLDRRWQDSDGEFSHPLGVFAKGTTIEVRVVAMAFEDDVPHVRAFVTTDGRVRQIIPADPAADESMTRANLWLRKGRYTV